METYKGHNRAPGSFEDLEVWQMSKEIVKQVYKLAKDFPKEESFGLVAQIKRAALSIPANIAEGFGRYHYLDKAKFYLNARGSLYEVKSHLLIAQELGYLKVESHRDSVGIDRDRVETGRDTVEIDGEKSQCVSTYPHKSQPISTNLHKTQPISRNVFSLIDTLSVKLNNLITATKKRSKEPR